MTSEHLRICDFFKYNFRIFHHCRFHYNQGIREGSAIRKLHTGDTLEFKYIEGEINGPAKLIRQDGGYENLQFVNGARQGSAEEVTSDGSREERVYINGVLQGPAVLHGANGDKLEFSYKDGGKFGAMTYFFRDGSIERSFFDEKGYQNGPTQLTWANGAKREGHKINGQWEGQVFYEYAEGPRKGKRDIEMWEHGKMVSSQKFYGEGENITINDWEDLKKLEVLGHEDSEIGKKPSPDKDVYFDCISNEESGL